jgi:hypothetical protein
LLHGMREKNNVCIQLVILFFFTKGDYGISRKEGVSMTAGPGTQFVTRNE